MPAFIDKIKTYPWRHNIKKLLFETPAEILIGVALLGTVFGIAGYRNRAARAGEIPIAFSEVEQITKDFNSQSKPVPPLTKFYAVNNDVAMKVFESNNIALAMGKTNLLFATELRTRIDAAFKVHPLISTYAQEMPDDAQQAMNSLNKLTIAANELPGIDAAFNKVWTEHHHDVTHIRHWTSRSCDSKGKNCHTVDHYTTVYDYTIHTYNYHPDAARRAAALLDDFVARNPDLTIGEKLCITHETHADNEEAIAKSMKRELKGKTPTADQYLSYTNTWARGSNFAKYAPGAAANYAALKSIAADWNNAMHTAHSEQYRTFSHSDSGPREYQVSDAEQSRGQGIVDASHHVVDGIRFSAGAVPALDAKIRQYVGVVLEHQPGDADQLRSDIMKMSREIYQKNYENGFDVQPFKWLDVILITMLGMAIGGGIGFGVDRFLDSRKEEWYEHDGENEPQSRRNRPGADWIPAPERIPEPQPAEEPAIPPDLRETGLPRPSWTPAPPKGVEVSPPLPDRPKPAAETSPPAVTDDAPQMPDPGAQRDKWVKKYKDLTP